MKNLKKALALFLVMVLVFSFSSFALADEGDDVDGDNEERTEQSYDVSADENGDEADGNDMIEDEDEDTDEAKDKGKGKAKGQEKSKAWEELKDLLEAQKDQVESVKDQLEQNIEALESQYEEAEASGNLELAAQLMVQIQEMKTEKDNLKGQMEMIKTQMKAAMRGMYTEEELEDLSDIAGELSQNPELFVLPVENVISTRAKFKFDTPPVIKGGRTLIPVRAIVEAFGAEVAWSPEEQTVTIYKDGKEISLQLGSRIVAVNGVEYQIDAPAELINNRTLVPLRFLAENFGLKVKWDDDDQTIEVDEDEQDEEGEDGSTVEASTE